MPDLAFWVREKRFWLYLTTILRSVASEVEIPAESVKDAENISKTFDELNHFIRGGVLVGHFAHIALKILRKEMAGHTFESPAIATARVHQWLLR